MGDMDDIRKLKEKLEKKGATELKPKTILGVRSMARKLEEESYQVDNKLLAPEYKMGRNLGKELGKKLKGI